MKILVCALQHPCFDTVQENIVKNKPVVAIIVKIKTRSHFLFSPSSPGVCRLVPSAKSLARSLDCAGNGPSLNDENVWRRTLKHFHQTKLFKNKEKKIGATGTIRLRDKRGLRTVC